MSSTTSSGTPASTAWSRRSTRKTRVRRRRRRRRSERSHARVSGGGRALDARRFAHHGFRCDRARHQHRSGAARDRRDRSRTCRGGRLRGRCTFARLEAPRGGRSQATYVCPSSAESGFAGAALRRRGPPGRGTELISHPTRHLGSRATSHLSAHLTQHFGSQLTPHLRSDLTPHLSSQLNLHLSSQLSERSNRIVLPPSLL